MTWRDKMYEAVAEMLTVNYGVDAVRVTDFEDYTAYGGYCETCSYSEVRCRITYVDSYNKTREYDYYGSFAELIRDIT